MKKLLFGFLILICFSNTNAKSSVDAKFDMKNKAFVLQLWKLYPEWATGMGYHKYDSVLTVYDAKQRKKEIKNQKISAQFL